MHVYRVSHTFLAAASRRHSRRKPRTTPNRLVAMAMDKDPMTNKYVGFSRKEMGSEALFGTVKHHDCHAFLVHCDAEAWPSKEFEKEGGDLASAMQDALTAASGLYKSGVFQFSPGSSAVGKVKLNLSEDGARSHPGDRPGDVLMFPQMRRHRLGGNANLAATTSTAIADFVESCVVKGDDSRESETLTGAHVFVCTHGKRDARCGLCGPALIDAFRAEIRTMGMEDVVAVRGCSHTGGHKYAGNVLIFLPDGGVMPTTTAVSAEANEKEGKGQLGKGKGRRGGGDGGGKVKGVWYGYVTPLEIPSILERTVSRGEIIPRLWRGSMGVRPEDHEAMAAAEAARLGVEWPPPLSPCDACAEEGGGAGGAGAGGGAKGGGGEVGDIEDVVGGLSGKLQKPPSSTKNGPVDAGGATTGAAAAGAGGAGRTGDAAASSSPFPPLWIDNVLIASACVGAAGMAAAWFLGVGGSPTY